MVHFTLTWNCFKDYIIQMLALMKHTFLKPHLEVLQHLPHHCLWYCCNFMTNKIFQLSVVYIQRLEPSGNPRVSNRKRIDLVSELDHGILSHSGMRYPRKISLRTSIDTIIVTEMAWLVKDILPTCSPILAPVWWLFLNPRHHSAESLFIYICVCDCVFLK